MDVRKAQLWVGKVIMSLHVIGEDASMRSSAATRGGPTAECLHSPTLPSEKTQQAIQELCACSWDELLPDMLVLRQLQVQRHLHYA